MSWGTNDAHIRDMRDAKVRAVQAKEAKAQQVRKLLEEGLSAATIWERLGQPRSKRGFKELRKMAGLL